MPRQAGMLLEKNFRNGLITEATELEFPEGACTETFDCEFDSVGAVRRRFGFDFETDFQTKAIDRTDMAVNTYLWKSVGGNGDITVLVVQVGPTIYFYDTSTTGNLSGGAIVDTVMLSPVAGANALQVQTVEAQFADGNGFLFVTHPYAEPQRIIYDFETHTVSQEDIIIKIRDFEGATADPFGVEDRPTSTFAALNNSHKYNLRNQGWTDASLIAWDTAQTTMPSNADVMWYFKNASEDLDFSTASLDRVTIGNTPAPKGHFISDLALFDRDAIGGTVGVADSTTGNQRPSTAAFFAGRVFFSGINASGYNSKIYFTQIVENDDQYGACHQVNDPTSENLFDLLPSDGGVISIPEAGTIIKLVTVPGGICVFSVKGVWFITGSTGIGFTATDYVVTKVANIESISASSFVSVAGYPCWWNGEGIYLMVAEGNLPQIKSITDGKIRAFYDDISLSSKRFAKGFYHNLDGHIRWVYRSTPTLQVTNIYEYDRVLSFNVLTGAWYPWTIPFSHDVKVNAIISSDVVSKAISTDDVIDNLDNFVIDNLGNQVTAFTDAGTQDPYFDRYMVSYFDGFTWQFTFADKTNSDFLDWVSYDDEGTDFESYFITGYKVRGDAGRKFQNNWIRIYSRIIDSAAYFFQGIWDYSTSGDTGRWSTKQLIRRQEDQYSVVSNRIKVRGHGLALQFKLSSVTREPFNIIGWSTLQTANAAP